MSMRTKKARWFQLLVQSNELANAAETLAQTNIVEIVNSQNDNQTAETSDLHEQLQAFSQLVSRYSYFWPQQDLHVSNSAGTAEQRLAHALAIIHTWQHDADPLISQIELQQSKQQQLNLIADWLKALEQSQLNFSLLGKPRHLFNQQLWVLTEKTGLVHYPHGTLVKEVMSGEKLFLYALGAIQQLEQLAQNLQPYPSQRIDLPDWLEGNAQQALIAVTQKIDAITNDLERNKGHLNALSQSCKLSEALADLMQLQWFHEHVQYQTASQNFAWLCGWTSDTTGDKLQDAIESAGIKALVSYPPPPAQRDSPLVMDNPSWARPFEVFASLLGTPGVNEADPAKLLAVIVPLIFGYMFGDVGHGLLLMAIGWAFHKRWPLLGVLFACGLSATLFGFVFGSIFGNESLLTPLWVNPVQQPLPVLLIPLAAGAVLLLLGMMINGLQAIWRGQSKNWLLCEAPVIVMYVALIMTVIDSRLLALFVVALVWYLIGHLMLKQDRGIKPVLVAFARLLETLFQLAVNTVSFIRVGAFALAHAGLSMAFVILAETISNQLIALVVLILGNLIVLVLEGLVVSIQTTRLILFEFFIRFLDAQGRTLRPLKAPKQAFFMRRKE